MMCICTGLAQGLIFHRIPLGQSKGPIQGAPHATTVLYSGSTDTKLNTCELSAVNFSAALLGQILVCKRTRKQYRVRRSVLCVCVCFLPIHSGHQVRWPYQPGSHRSKVTQDFSPTFFLRCVP